MITERTIEYLKNIQKDGNIDVHNIITQLSSKYPSEKKEEINTLLVGLLPLYQVLNGKSILISDSATHFKITKKLNLLKNLSGDNVRDIIKNIKSMDKEEMSDLIVDLEYDKLIEIIEKMIAEIIIIDTFEEYEDKSNIFDFIIYSIRIRSKDPEKLTVFSNMISVVISQNNHFRVNKLQEVIPKFLELDLFKQYCIDNRLIPEIIDLFCRSASYQVAGINTNILSKFSSELVKSDMDKIIECSIKNNQIYESTKAKSVLKSLFIGRQDIFDFEYNKKLQELGIGIPDLMIL